MRGRYYHDAAAGEYHLLRHLGPGKWMVCLRLDQDGAPRSWTGARSLADARRVLQHLAPGAIELDGLPAFLR